MEFLHQNPENWTFRYIKTKNIVNKLKVKNVVAERGVKLMEDLNTKFKKNENKKQ